MNTEKIKELFKFSWSQAFSDSNGKSSILPMAGAYIVLVGGLGFLYGGVTKDTNLITQSVIMTGIGAGILMGRKIVNGKPGDLPFMDQGNDKPNQS